jgi:hypothetical protein
LYTESQPWDGMAADIYEQSISFMLQQKGAMQLIGRPDA